MSRDEVQAFNVKLVDLFYEGHSVAELAKTYGRSVSTINKLVQLDKVQNGPRERQSKPRDPRVLIDKKSLSNRHAWIGSRLAAYRARHNLTPSAMGLKLSVSRVKVTEMEIGAYDFTLTDVDRIAKLLDCSSESLLSESLLTGGPKLYDEGKAA